MRKTRQWSDEEIKTLRLLWPRGEAIAEIVEKVGHPPSSVSAKAREIGLPTRMPSDGRMTGHQRADDIVSCSARCGASPCSPLITKTKTTCQWPIGDPGEDGFHFCGKPTAVTGGPYCEEHYGRAHVVTPKWNINALASLW